MKFTPWGNGWLVWGFLVQLNNNRVFVLGVLLAVIMVNFATAIPLTAELLRSYLKAVLRAHCSGHFRTRSWGLRPSLNPQRSR